MKNLLKVLGFFFVISLGCSDIDDKSSQPNSLEMIILDDVKSLMPVELLNNKHIIFKNDNGDEWKMSTTFQTTVLENKVNGIDYKHEQFIVRYNDNNEHSFRMDINGTGLYSLDNDIQKSISAFLMPANPSGSASVSIEVENGAINVNDFDNYNSSLMVNSKEFENVFVGTNSFNTSNEYSEIMMNLSFGVVAFRDENNTLWAFDKFED